MEHVIRCINIYIFSLHWLTWDLVGVLICIFPEDCCCYCCDTCCRCCILELRRAAASDRSCVVYFEKNVLPADPCVVARRFFLRCNSCFAWLQAL
jgi:hypothetical protein